MEGCYYFGDKFLNCDWRNGQFVGGIFDELIFDRCDLSNTRWGKGSRSVGGEYAGLGSWTVHYKNTIDKNGVFHSGIYCSLPDPNDDIPFW